MTSEGATPMEASSIPQVKKQRFRNESGGFIGVVKISVKGEEEGAAVEPGGTVELTYDEMVATANAPRDAKDNPFLPQTFTRVRESDSEIEHYEITPLVPISEFRYVPVGDRPVPGFTSEGAPVAAGHDAVEPPPSDPDPAPPTAAQTQPPQPPTRAAAAAAEAAAAAAQEAAQPDPAPEAPEEPTVTGETAAEAPTGTEETGAAAQPTGEPVGGEFAAHEEVGVPATEVQGHAPGGDPTPPGATPGIAGPPAPWSPAAESDEDAEQAGRVAAPDPSGE